LSKASEVQKPRSCPLGVAFTTHGDPVYLMCKTWKCPSCAKSLSRKWAKRAVAAFSPDTDGAIAPYWFLTLTLSSYYRTPEQGFGALRKLWDATRKAFQRNYDHWQYLAFVEGQPERDHMPHFHILSAELPPGKLNKKGKLTTHALHDWAVALGWGFEVDLKTVDGIGAAYYVSKYASKVSPNHPANLRRVRCSQDWPKVPKEAVEAVVVRFKGELLHRYIARVGQFCQIPLEDLQIRYVHANEMLAQMV